MALLDSALRSTVLLQIHPWRFLWAFRKYNSPRVLSCPSANSTGSTSSAPEAACGASCGWPDPLLVYTLSFRLAELNAFDSQPHTAIPAVFPILWFFSWSPTWWVPCCWALYHSCAPLPAFYTSAPMHHFTLWAFGSGFCFCPSCCEPSRVQLGLTSLGCTIMLWGLQ